LSVWWLDEAHSLWVKLPGGAVDPLRQNVSVPIRHFSVYAVMGAPTFQVGDVYAFPVPWRPQGSRAGLGPGQTGTLSDGITFTNMPEQAVVRVYTMSGNLVREILHSDGMPQLKWDVKNSSGEDVVSGTYIYVVESHQSRKKGQLVIIR